jgi:hypothetical protein
MIDLTAFGQGAGIVLLGWFCGVVVSVAVDVIRNIKNA